MMGCVALSLGSNVGDRLGHLRAAVARLSDLGSVKAVSSVYETEPVELSNQPCFYNLAVLVDSPCEPQELLERSQSIERALGRVRRQPKGPREIDIDILLIDERIVSTPTLRVPHPAMTSRRFVLEPLAEIGPELIHPETQRSVGALLASCRDGSRVVRTSESI